MNELILTDKLMTISMPVDITKEMVMDMLVDALEEGSNYWYSKAHYILPDGIEYEDFRPDGKFADVNKYYHPLEIVPFVPSCYLTVEDDEGKVHKLGLEEIVRGLELMKNKHTQHWLDFVTGNADADTADVWFQLCLFGEVVYG
jgi:hypothetical protein